jgi:hypothetical protein
MIYQEGMQKLVRAFDQLMEPAVEAETDDVCRDTVRKLIVAAALIACRTKDPDALGKARALLADALHVLEVVMETQVPSSNAFKWRLKTRAGLCQGCFDSLAAILTLGRYEIGFRNPSGDLRGASLMIPPGYRGPHESEFQSTVAIIEQIRDLRFSNGCTFDTMVTHDHQTESSPSSAEINRQKQALLAFMATKRLRSR